MSDTLNEKIEPIFKRLASIDVSSFTEKKGKLTYLSWAHAWRIFKTECPDAVYHISRFDGESFCLADEELGLMVHTSVTACDETHEMWLPVMDYRNKALNPSEATMFEVNKTIMRCLVKNLAMFGLGINIYAGEDLPTPVEEKPKQQAKPDPRAVVAKRLEADKEAKWFEVVLTDKKGHKYKGLTLGDIVAEGDAAAIKQVLDYIDPVALEHELAVRHLKEALTEIENAPKGSDNANAKDGAEANPDNPDGPF